MLRLLALLTLFFSYTLFAQTGDNINTLNTNYQKKAQSLIEKIRGNTTLNYYLSINGPSAAGKSNISYNPFIADQSPLQTFHSANLRFSLPKNFAFGFTLAGVHYFSRSIDQTYGTDKDNRALFNPRAYISFPGYFGKHITIFNSLAYEFPQSKISQDNEMYYGLVFSQAISLTTPYNSPWRFGLLTQVERFYYQTNTIYSPKACSTCTPTRTELQTLTLSTGPYINYRLNDKWSINNLLTFEWDQKGDQSGTTNLNNNLPDRWRTSLNYYPRLSYPLSQVGVFFQGITKPAADTTIIGLDMTARF